jgi:hypothetical protein
MEVQYTAKAGKLGVRGQAGQSLTKQAVIMYYKSDFSCKVFLENKFVVFKKNQDSVPTHCASGRLF